MFTFLSKVYNEVGDLNCVNFYLNTLHDRSKCIGCAKRRYNKIGMFRILGEHGCEPEQF